MKRHDNDDEWKIFIYEPHLFATKLGKMGNQESDSYS